MESSIESISNLVGFVPQDDVMHRELTVREILKTYARLRLPKRYVAAEVERIVEDVIDALELDTLLTPKLGTSQHGNIGRPAQTGQCWHGDGRGPISAVLGRADKGSDSTTSFELIDALGILAKRRECYGGLAPAVLRTLREIYKRPALGRGGRTVYLGKSNEAMKYFTDLRFQKPPNMNPADFLWTLSPASLRGTILAPPSILPGDAALAYFEGLKTKMANRVWNHGVAKSAPPEDAEQVDPQARVQGMSEEQLREEMTEAEAAELRRIELFDLWLQCGEPFTHSAMEGFVDAVPIEKAVYEQTEYAGPLA